MACKAAQTRITQTGWLEQTSNTGVQVANPNGASYIALGSLDTVGGVQVACARPQSNGQSNFIVSAGAPFVGYIDGPFTLLPLYTITTFAFSFTPAVLDVLIFEDLPPVPVGKRAPLLLLGSFLPAGNLFVGANVRGRARISIAISEGIGTDIWGGAAYQFAAVPAAPPTIAAATAIVVQNFSYTAAQVGVAVVHEFQPLEQPQKGTYPGTDIIDYLTVGSTSTTPASGTALILQAWD